MKYKVTKEYLSTTGTHRKAGQIVHVPMPSKHTEDLVRFGFLEKIEKAKPIKSKLANLLIAPEDYIEGNKKHFTYDEAVAIEKKLEDGWRLPTRHEWALICEEFACGSDGQLDPKLLTKNLGLGKKGYASSGSLASVGSDGYYWSRTAGSSTNAYRLYFNSSGVYPANGDNRYYGFSVRLVKELEG